MRFPIDLAVTVNAEVTVAVLRDLDASELFDAIDHDAVWTHIPGARPRTADQLSSRLIGSPTQQPLVIRHGGEVVGTCRFTSIQRIRREWKWDRRCCRRWCGAAD